MIHAITILLFFPLLCEEKMRSACTSIASYYRTGIGLRARRAPDCGTFFSSQWTGLSKHREDKPAWTTATYGYVNQLLPERQTVFS